MNNNKKLVVGYSLTLLIFLGIFMLDFVLKGLLVEQVANLIMYPFSLLFFAGLIFCVIYAVKSSGSKPDYLLKFGIFIVLFWIILGVLVFAHNAIYSVMKKESLAGLAPGYISFTPNFFILKPIIPIGVMLSGIILIAFVIGIFFVKKQDKKKELRIK